ncbi:hypothetical protein BGZ96_003817 [Linnemannia gamsii]|uniref:Uncharacterized protein n=1 Tax=Linnemannia gamsii TaxID=64522 RepID=A0ABQ7JIS0_9FUNG|nr:hypothetical protein BGZ96_003817 [Linnemannia gamsii]
MLPRTEARRVVDGGFNDGTPSRMSVRADTGDVIIDGDGVPAEAGLAFVGVDSLREMMDDDDSSFGSDFLLVGPFVVLDIA